MNEKDRREVQALIERRSIPEPNTGCWLWDAATDQDGYGKTKWKGVSRPVHRLSFEAFAGIEPGRSFVMHSCDIACCVNPLHLSLGTNAENTAERTAKGRSLGRGGKSWRMAKGATTTHSFVRVTGTPVTAAALRETIAYNPDTGEFRWLERAGDHGWTRKYAGKVAGHLSQHGKRGARVLYRRIRVFGRDHYAHRLAWLYVHGEWPESHEIDHKNGDMLDNRIDNLRRATHSQNGHNTGLRRNNTSGVKGVSWDASRKRWFASITEHGKIRGLGRFDSFDDAVAARRKAEAEYHGDYANTAGTA